MLGDNEVNTESGLFFLSGNNRFLKTCGSRKRNGGAPDAAIYFACLEKTV